MTGYRIREAGPADALALTEALVEAATWNALSARPRVQVLADPVRRRYIAGWQRPGDAGFLAVDDTGQPIGAGWYRLFPADRPGLGFVGTGVPELILGVRPVWRAQGVGRALLQRLVARAAADGHARVGLSVVHRRYVPYSDAHYAGHLVDGAYSLKLFGDLATDLCIVCDGDEGLFASYADVQFLAPVRAGDVLEVTGTVTRVGTRSRELALSVRVVARGAATPDRPGAAAVLPEPVVATTATGVIVVPPLPSAE